MQVFQTLMLWRLHHSRESRTNRTTAGHINTGPIDGITSHMEVTWKESSHTFDIAQLGRGGMLVKWDNTDSPEADAMMPLKLDFGGEDRSGPGV